MDDLISLEHLQQTAESTIPPAENPPLDSTPSQVVTPPPAVESSPAQMAASLPTLPPIVPPIREEPDDNGQPPRLITIYLRQSGDLDRDRRRIKNVYGILISHPGRDRFQFQIFENGRGHLIDFPNDTTRINADVLERLKKLVGEDTWRVEEITYQ